MEIAAPKSSPRSKKVENSSEYHSAKPLPPTPTLQIPLITSSRASSLASSRAPSTASLSSVYTEDVPPTPKYVPFRRETILPAPKVAYEASMYRSSTSMVPDMLPSRPKPTRHAKTQAILQKPAAIRTGPPESIFSEWRAPRYEEQNDDEGPRFPTPVRILAEKSREVQHIAEQHADEYRSILPRASTLASIDSEPYYDGLNSLPAPMSPRITDVVDETLVPRPLRMSTAIDSNASSHFSSTSSELMAFKREGGASQKSRAKAFQSRTHSQETPAKKSAISNTATKSSNVEDRSKVMSMTPSERASIQKGIIDMYDNLTSLYDPSNRYAPPPRPKPKIEFPLPKRDVLKEYHESTVMPRTPYQRSGHKAGENAESPSPSPRSKPTRRSWFMTSPGASTPKRSHFSLSSKASSSDGSHPSLSSAEKKKMKSYTFPRDSQNTKKKKSSSGGKWKKAVRMERKKGRKTEDERRRDDMKKKIVILGAITQGPFGL